VIILVIFKLQVDCERDHEEEEFQVCVWIFYVQCVMKCSQGAHTKVSTKAPPPQGPNIAIYMVVALLGRLSLWNSWMKTKIIYMAIGLRFNYITMVVVMT
jgi:hypothetical protein